MPDPRDDYPAAHSMDTTWFAVDADGHLAVFDSGEDGAVPEAVTSDAEGWEVAKRLGRDVPHLVWANGSVRGRHCREPGEADAPGRGLYGVLLFLRRAPDWDTPSPFNQHIGTQIDTPDGRLIPVYCEWLKDDAYDRLHREGACAGCGGINGRGPGNLGFFEYECYVYGVEPYTRVGVPAHPLREQDLPPDLLADLTAIRLDAARFARAPLLQPVEHTPCHVWGGGERDTFVRSDGKTVAPLPRSSP